MASLATAIFKKVVLAKETTWGTKPATNTGKYGRRTGLEVNLTRAGVESQEINAHQQVNDFRLGLRTLSGTWNAELSCSTWELFLAAALRAGWTAGVTSGPLTTVSFAAATKKISRSSGSWITDGFKLGDLINVAGAATAGNNGRAIVVGVTAADLTVDKVLVNESAGASVTVNVPGKKLSVPMSGHTDDSFTIEEFYSDISVSERNVGVKVGGFELSLSPDSMATINFDLMGKNKETDTTAYFVSPAAATTTASLSSAGGYAYTDNAPATLLTGLSLTLTGNMEAAQVIGADTAAAILPGRIQVSGELSAFFVDNSLADKFLNETEIGIGYRFDGGGESMVFKLPRVKLGGASKNDAPTGGIIITAPFTALLYSGTGAAENTTICIQDTTLA
ncbi:phage tail tube protein [Chitinolyticbacter meiyuanensis]|uniref:phage tail tube protein n=1 Tax=Chitinolyticbacter meiyuanensis TaxID=682798 RepID=UPI0011E5B1E7|nr:phage tail tube protein [Chitinolyticbacter meiyuanensis]